MSMARRGISWAGLAFGASAVAFNTEVGYSLVSANCAQAKVIVLSTAIISVSVVLIGGLLSAPAWFARSAPGIDEPPERAAPRGMIAGVGVLAALLFSLIIVLQGAAALLIQGCQR
jgi:hypothetical protein